ncbi:hypothetical protein IWX90DRAFT_165214 [Phyllosticta citrichinensis]|uniref:Uncharacterized protein n=1 Tax=Phyllosticta citrichinensis TaxID=1130410 RepID=A0ABR1Y1B6_9PEZI
MDNQSASSSPDREWVPKNRPQSTVAQNFSAALDDIFNLNGKFDDVDKNLDQKQQTLATKNAELEALEARLRAAEERLKQARGGPDDESATPKGKAPQPNGQPAAADKTGSFERPASKKGVQA